MWGEQFWFFLYLFYPFSCDTFNFNYLAACGVWANKQQIMQHFWVEKWSWIRMREILCSLPLHLWLCHTTWQLGLLWENELWENALFTTTGRARDSFRTSSLSRRRLQAGLNKWLIRQESCAISCLYIKCSSLCDSYSNLWFKKHSCHTTQQLFYNVCIDS